MKRNFTKRIHAVFKICAIQTIMALALNGYSFAANSPQLLDQVVSVHLTSVSFENALKQIGTIAKVKFVYSLDQLSVEGNVSLQADNRTLREILDELLSPRNIKYKVHEREASITLKKQRENTNKSQSFFEENIHNPAGFLLQITGLVTDASTQQPMAGVNIIVKGTTNGTATDAEGKYSIRADEGDMLVFSFIGYSPVELKVSSSAVVDVTLHEDIKSLDAVEVNAGYWTVTKEQQTGNIVKVRSEDIEKQPVSNPLASLQGRVTGLEIVQTTGMPGGNFTVRIRGQNSIASGNDPLYIVDGVPFISSSMAAAQTSGLIYLDGASPLNTINPADIESIEVLKDADATAIYGSRGANGVILITTKKGVEGKTKVDLNFSTGIGKVGRSLDLLNAQQYLEMRKEAFQNDAQVPTSVNAPDLVSWDTTRNTNWQEVLLGGNAHYTDAGFSISGGEKYTQFSVGTGYHRETTVFPGDNFDQRLSAHVNLTNTSPGQKLKTNVSFNYSVNSTNLLKRDLTALALTLAPVAPPLYDEMGNLNWGAKAWNGTDSNINPLSYTKSIFESRTHTLIGNALLSYAIIPGLEARASVGLTSINMKAITATPKSALDPAMAAITQNSSAFAGNNFHNWIFEPQLNWQRRIGSGMLDALAGMSFLEQINEGIAQYGNGFSSEALMKNINAADVIVKASSNYSQYRYHAVFGRINYNWKEMYILNLTGRRDGSSRFGPEKQFANFGALGAAWIFSKSKFVTRSFSALSFGKLRASYGVTGNDQIGDYQFLDTYSATGSGLYMGAGGLSPQRLYNPDFAWELVRKIEAGIDLGFLEDKIFLAVSYYRNRSSNQLVGTPLPPTTGFTSIQSNFPATVQNTGLEAQLTLTAVQRPTFTWTTSINFTLPRNKLVEFEDLETSQYANRYVEGQPLNIVKRYHYLGVNPTNGVYDFEDVNGDNNFNITDRQTIKFLGRDFYGGILNSLQYEGFQLDFLFEYVKQQGSNYLSYSSIQPGGFANATTFVNERWQRDGDMTDIQRFSNLSLYRSAYTMLQSSDRSVSDASFIRLKNVFLSWSMPRSWIGKVHMQDARVFLRCQNVLTLTKYKGLDPENQYAVLPPLRVVTAGAHLTF